MFTEEPPQGYLPEIVVVAYAGEKTARHHKSFETDILPRIENPEVDREAVCSENFGRWLNLRLLYPAEAKEDDGTVLAQFTVGKDGKVKDIRILWSVSEPLDDIVAQQIAKSPSWTPAMKNGKPVETVLIQPVIFMLRPSSKTASPIELNIRADGTIESGGKVYTVGQLKEILPSHNAGEPLTAVQIIAADDVRMGAIEDVKEELRKRGALKVQYYSSANGQEGVTRYMPPFPRADNAKKSDYPEDLWTGVNRENVFMVRINSNDKIFFGDRPRQDDEDMLRTGKDFLKARGKEARFFLTVDRGASYEAYRHMQELLWQIYYEARNEKALEQYGRPLQELSADEQSHICKMIPLSISEAEPKGKR